MTQESHYPEEIIIGSQMNIWGQIKLTEYFGSLIEEQYGIKPMNQTEKVKAQWEECALYTQEYIDLAIQAFEENNDIWINELANPWLFRK